MAPRDEIRALANWLGPNIISKGTPWGGWRQAGPCLVPVWLWGGRDLGNEVMTEASRQFLPSESVVVSEERCSPQLFFSCPLCSPQPLQSLFNPRKLPSKVTFSVSILLPFKCSYNMATLCDVVFSAGDTSTATETNPFSRLAHLFQHVQKLNGQERGKHSDVFQQPNPCIVGCWCHDISQNFITLMFISPFKVLCGISHMY